eukprot:GHVL01030719.1.p1 GENE.GHVL01030719.1~~GHVL01030719.1.p1  ORF type:complete len:421 (+),score=44.96 GHVL01030719.1:98-1360(+)
MAGAPASRKTGQIKILPRDPDNVGAQKQSVWPNVNCTSSQAGSMPCRKSSVVAVDEDLLHRLMDMGFAPQLAERALLDNGNDMDLALSQVLCNDQASDASLPFTSAGVAKRVPSLRRGGGAVGYTLSSLSSAANPSLQNGAFPPLKGPATSSAYPTVAAGAPDNRASSSSAVVQGGYGRNQIGTGVQHNHVQGKQSIGPAGLVTNASSSSSLSCANPVSLSNNSCSSAPKQSQIKNCVGSSSNYPMQQQQQQQTFGMGNVAAAVTPGNSLTDIKVPPIKPGDTKTVLFAYEAKEANQLSLRKNEVVSIVSVHYTGWTYGKVQGEPKRQGWFPHFLVSWPVGTKSLNTAVSSSSYNGGVGAGPGKNAQANNKTRPLNVNSKNDSEFVSAPEEVAYWSWTPDPNMPGMLSVAAGDRVPSIVE